MAKVTWRVVSVVDTEATGMDYAHTVGVAEYGIPELHVWARPSEGEDPGADWRLSSLDMVQLLNEVGLRHVERPLVAGETFDDVWDTGYTVGHFVVSPERTREEVEAWSSPEGTRFLTLLWALERTEEGEAKILSEEEEREVLDLLDEVAYAGALEHKVAVLVERSAALEQEMGPWSGVVEGVREILREEDQGVVVSLLDRAVRVRSEVASAGGVAQAVGRRVGRAHEVERARGAGAEDAEVLAEKLSGLALPRDVLVGVLSQVLGSAYSTLVVYDALSSEERDAGAGLVLGLVLAKDATRRALSHPEAEEVFSEAGDMLGENVEAMLQYVQEREEEIFHASTLVRALAAVWGVGGVDALEDEGEGEMACFDPLEVAHLDEVERRLASWAVGDLMLGRVLSERLDQRTMGVLEGLWEAAWGE